MKVSGLKVHLIFVIVSFMLLVLFTHLANAEPIMLKLKWKNPTHREDNTPLVLNLSSVYELRKTNVFTVNCDTGGDVEPLFMELPAFITYKYWSGEPGTCVRLTVVDTDGRESRYSDIMKPWDASQPNPVECSN